ncbi:hypothetical protein DFJ73DRAFT_890204 [Zopfochytrium polystomum]|nr:hypothetical protein DFJ73DRAFT_890204 [Zopfochytrium polystomum]
MTALQLTLWILLQMRLLLTLLLVLLRQEERRDEWQKGRGRGLAGGVGDVAGGILTIAWSISVIRSHCHCCDNGGVCGVGPDAVAVAAAVAVVDADAGGGGGGVEPLLPLGQG